MLDSDFNGSEFQSKPTQKQKQEQQLHDAIMAKTDIPFQQQAEKKMQVYEAAKRLDLPAFMEWMFDKKYFIGKF